MVSDFLSAGMDGSVFRLSSQTLSRFLDAIGQSGSKTFALDHLIQHHANGLRIAPGQLDSAGILFRDPAFLITFHGKGDRTTG